MRLLPLVLLLPVGLAAAPAPVKVPPKEIRKTLPLADGKTLFLESRTGDVSIRPGKTNQAEVLAQVVADGDCSDNKERVAKTDVLFDAIPEGLRVRTIQDNSKADAGVLGAFIKTCDAPHVNYTVLLPKTTRLDVRLDRSGTVDIQEMDADFRLKAIHGKVSGRALSGAADVELRGGEVRLAFRRFSRPSRVQLYGGMAELSVPRNARFDLRYDGHGRFATDFPAKPGEVARVNGGGPRLELAVTHGLCRVIGAEPVPDPTPAKPARPAAKKQTR